MNDGLVAPLLRWYRTVGRTLPWRSTKDPYRIWISEIMLQQTQIRTVIPYYERFLHIFPKVDTLARARLQTVLKTWEGLGYYARARNLHRAAKRLSRNGFPRTARGWMDLPGVGPYTAAAIASIAFEEPVPVWDGNVRRVISRVAAIKDEASLKESLSQIVPHAIPGDFNQALMELGQTLCVPREPKCLLCPITQHCKARRTNRIPEFPSLRKRPKPPHFEVALGLVVKGGRILVQRRPLNGLLGGLWEFPGGKRERTESLATCARREVQEETGIEVQLLQRLPPVRHAYTHFSVELHPFICRPVGGRIRKGRRWVSPKGLQKLPMPAANLKVLWNLTQTTPTTTFMTRSQR